MKFSVLSFVALTTVLFACGGSGISEETKTAINSFEGDWTSANSQLKELSDKFAAGKDSAAAKCNSLMLDEALKAKLKANAAMADSLKNQCNTLTAWYETAGAEVAAMTSKMTDGTATYNALKEQVNAGTIKEDSAKASLQALQTTLENGKAKIAEWSAALDKNNTEVAAVATKFKELVAKVSAPKKK